MPWSEIRTNGWRQGNFLNESCTPNILTQCNQDCHADSRLILLSHDCDIVHNGNSEPNVEVCIAEPLLAGPNGNYTHGKNPRILHLDIDHPDTPAHFEIHASKRFWIDRKALIDFTPDENLILKDSELDILVNWVAAKFNRAAFPDSFNKRLETSRKDIHKIAKKSGRHLSGVYFALSTLEELNDGEQYSLMMLGLMEPDKYSDQDLRNRCSEAITKISTKINSCIGIEVEDYQVRSEDEISLHEISQFARFPFDYLSFRLV